MSPDDVLALAETMMDDAPDADEMAALMDAAYSSRNDERAWSFLIKLDSSIQNLSSDSWQTAKTLPTDFDQPIKLFLGAGGDNEFDPVPYEEILMWKGSANKYSIDFSVPSLRFMGPGNGDVAYLWYKYFPTSLIGLTALQSAAAATIVWPKRFCTILAMDMAAMHMGGFDADDTTRQQVPFINATHKRLYNSFIGWDNKRRMMMRMHSATPRRSGDSRSRPDVVSGI